jgi:predicted transcriptional regulator
MEQKNAQDAIIQAISHSERREILRIIQRQPEGIRYSSILGETQLTTSKLNYQLNELQGLVEKNQDGLYTLTLLGQKAINILDNINQNLDGDLELAPMLGNRRKKYVTKKLNGLFYFLITLSAVGPLVLTYFYFAEPGNGITTWILILTYLLVGAFMYGLNQLRKNSPKYFLGFIDWLDWKFFNGKGSDNFRGRKLFVLTVLGFVLGALVRNAGLGLILGLFIGAAMEYQGGA